MLAFMRGVLYPEFEAQSRMAFTVHSSDFVFHQTPVQVCVTLYPRGRMSIDITGREHLSGSTIPERHARLLRSGFRRHHRLDFRRAGDAPCLVARARARRGNNLMAYVE